MSMNVIACGMLLSLGGMQGICSIFTTINDHLRVRQTSTASSFQLTTSPAVDGVHADNV